MSYNINNKSIEIVKIPDLYNEVWEYVVGYEKKYQVSNLGRVKRSGYNKVSKDCKYRRAYKDEKEIAQMIRKNGYKKLSLGLNKVIKNELVHRLVALAFIQNPMNKKCVNHIDGNKENNNVKNLEWATSKENINHAIDIGLVDNKGENSPVSKLTNGDVIKIKSMFKSGVLPISISNILRIKYVTVYSITSNRNWKHIKI